MAGTVRIADAHRGPVRSVIIATGSDGPLIVSAGADGTVRRWDAASGTSVGEPLPGYTGAFWSVTASTATDGAPLLVSAGADGNLHRWNLDTGAAIGDTTAEVLAAAVRSVASGRDRNGHDLIATASEDGTVCLWDPTSGAPIGDGMAGHSGVVWSVAVGNAPDGTPLVISGGDDGTVRRWDRDSGAAVWISDVPRRRAVLCVALGPGIRGAPLLVGGDEDGNLWRWDALSGERIGTELGGHDGPVWAVALGVDLGGAPLLVSASEDGTVRRWDPLTGDAVGHVIRGHKGPVLSVALADGADGRQLLVSAGADGTVRRWNAATGASLGRPLVGHAGRVWSLALGAAASGLLLASAGADAAVRRWDAETGAAIGEPLQGHTGAVLSLALGTGGDGPPLLVSAGADGCLRRWDPASGTALGASITGHDGEIWSVALGTGADGSALCASGGQDGAVRSWDASTGAAVAEVPNAHRGAVWSVVLTTGAFRSPELISGGEDGAIRRWNPRSGASIGGPLLGHHGRVWSLALGFDADGSPLLVSGGEDGTVRLWDLTTGTPRGDPLEGHVGAVWSVAVGPGSDGVPLLMSGGADGTVRRWDSSSGAQVGLPLTGHTAPVLSVALGGDARAVSTVASSAIDGTIVVSSAAALDQPAGELAVVLRTGAPAVRDDTSATDRLGRALLAEHIHGLLEHLTTPKIGDPSAGSAVLHIDGRWGSGKSTLVMLLCRSLGETFSTDGSLAAQGAPGDGANGVSLRHPIVIHYDAWRESAIAPEWWSLATSINRAVRRERAGTTQLAMTIEGGASRLCRSPPVLLAFCALALLLYAHKAQWWGDASALSDVLTLLAAVAAIGVSAGRALFWAAPTFGRLSLGTENNPLGEVSHIVARLRRWSPREVKGHKLADVSIVLWIELVLGATVPAMMEQASGGNPGEAVATVLAHRQWLVAAVVGLTLVGVLLAPRTERSTNARRSFRKRMVARDIRSLGAALVYVCRCVVVAVGIILIALAMAGIAYIGMWRSLPSWLDPANAWHPEIWALSLLAVGSAVYASWARFNLRAHRRPLLLVVDDIDRCTSERAVRLLEAVHTLLRERHAPALLPRWRAPAQLIVLVLADGRWVRTAFQAAYSEFSSLGSPVHGLGADFLQKVFDHTVLVPALTVSQVQTMINYATQSAEDRAEPAKSTAQAGSDTVASRDDVTAPIAMGPSIAAAAAVSKAHREMDQSPGDLRSAAVEAAISSPDLMAHDRMMLEHLRVRIEASQAAAESRGAHLLADKEYARLLPANPRLVLRVANAWGMLLALKDHLGHSESADTIVRAAIMFVRFPSLVDSLLTDARPLHLEPAKFAPARVHGYGSAWLHPDVQLLLRRSDGSGVSVEAIARCYGRDYAHDPAAV